MFYLEQTSIRWKSQTRLPKEWAAIFAPRKGGWGHSVALTVQLHWLTEHRCGIHLFPLDVRRHCGTHEDKHLVVPIFLWAMTTSLNQLIICSGSFTSKPFMKSNLQGNCYHAVRLNNDLGAQTGKRWERLTDTFGATSQKMLGDLRPVWNNVSILTDKLIPQIQHQTSTGTLLLCNLSGKSRHTSFL